MFHSDQTKTKGSLIHFSYQNTAQPSLFPNYVMRNLYCFIIIQDNVMNITVCLSLIYFEKVKRHACASYKDLAIRNINPAFLMVSIYKRNNFRSEIKNEVSYMRLPTVCRS